MTVKSGRVEVAWDTLPGRLVHSDGRVRFQGRTWPMSAPASSRVTVCWQPAERLVILWNDQPVGAYAL